MQKPVWTPAVAAPPIASTPLDGLPYEVALSQDLSWAMSEGSRFFQGSAQVQQALHKLARRLNDLGIPYAVAGGMALFAHGYRRFTEDIDVLVTAEGLQQAQTELEGRGYVRPFDKSKNLRDCEHGVGIKFLITGQFPGDGKPKPVAFPNPAGVAIDFDGVRYLNLPTLIELKLASGMTNTGRLKDLADVQEVIKLLQLPADFAVSLNQFVRAEFARLHQQVQQSAT